MRDSLDCPIHRVSIALLLTCSPPLWFSPSLLDNDLAPPLPLIHGLAFDPETKGGDGDAGEGEIAGGDEAASIAPSVPGAF
jgi:hypothetical protein